MVPLTARRLFDVSFAVAYDCSRSARPEDALVGLLAGLVGFQNPYHRKYRVPTPRCRRRAKQPVDLAEIADRFHVAAVHPIDETILRANDSYKPVPAFGKSHGKGNFAMPGFRQYAYKLNNICGRCLNSERIVHLQPN